MSKIIAVPGALSGRDAQIIKAVIDGILPEIANHLDSALLTLNAEAQAQVTRLSAFEAQSAALVAENVELRKRLEAIESAKPVEAVLAEAIAALPAPQDGKSVSLDDVRPMIDDAVAAAVAQLPPPINGKDADPDAIVDAVAAAVAALPVPQDGKSVTLADVEPAIEEAVTRAVAALPAPANGKDADPAEIKAAVDAAVAALPAPKDGRSVTVDDVEPLIEKAVTRAVAALPAAKDGIGLAGALIDRDGALKMTLSDGRMVDLGRVEGKNGDPGLGFDDMEVVFDGERSFALEFARGDQVKSYTFALPMMIDRGVYRAGQAYQKGDCVTFGGSLWIAQANTEAKPDGADSGWRLGVKRGRDGKSVEGQ